MIELENIDFFYNENNFIFKEYSLSLDEQKKYWLIGKNGSGKTTLLELLLGIKKIKKGRCNLSYSKHDTLFVPSTPFYEPYMKLADFLLFYLNKMLKIPMHSIQIDNIIEALDIKNNLKILCKDLSKGTKQKILLSPLFTEWEWKHFYLDEPFEHLDMKTCNLVKQKLFETSSFLLIINHKEHLLAEISELERIVL